MASSDLFDAFDDCITRLNAGQSVENCLRAYPQYASTLRPMLETGLAVRRAAPVVPAGARNRVRGRVIRTRVPRWRAYRVRSAAAAVAVALFVTALIVIWFNQDDDWLRIEPIPTVDQTPPTPTPSQTPTLTSTPTGTASPTPTATETVDPLPAAAPAGSPQGATSTPTVAPICHFKVTVSSANLRQGPGTGYSTLGFAYAGDEYPVRARHASADWLEITTEGGSAWIAASVGELNGECADLPVSDTPFVTGGGSNDGNSGPGGSGDGSSDGDGSGSQDLGGDASSGSGGTVNNDGDGEHADVQQEIEGESQSPEPPDEN